MSIEPAAGAAVDRVLTPHTDTRVKDQPRVQGTEKNTRAVEDAAAAKKNSGHSETDSAAVKQAAEQIDKFLKYVSQDLNISVDSDTGETVVKVVNSESKQVIRQIPSEEVLALMKRLSAIAKQHSSDNSGLLIKDQA